MQKFGVMESFLLDRKQSNSLTKISTNPPRKWLTLMDHMTVFDLNCYTYTWFCYCIFVQKKEKYTSKSFKENRDQDEHVYRPDFIDRDFFSNVTPKIWDHKNVPYSSHNKHHSDYYWGSQECEDIYNESSSSTTTTTSRRRLSTCVVAWLIIGFIIIAAGCVTTYFVYFRNCKCAYHIANITGSVV